MKGEREEELHNLLNVVKNEYKNVESCCCNIFKRHFFGHYHVLWPRCCHSFFSGGLWRDLVSPSVWGHNCCSQVRREVPWMERWGYSRRDLKYKGDNLLWVPKTNLGCSSLLGEIGFCYKKYFPRIRKANAMGVPTSTLPWVGKGRGLSKKKAFAYSI